MRGSYGKPHGMSARVSIGQILISVRSRDVNQKHMIEALRRAKFKFPGRQKIVLSRKWGFTKYVGGLGGGGMGGWQAAFV
jgi:large subunit ribosomal protein L10e